MSTPNNKFHELVGRLRTPGDDEELPPSIYDDLTNEYNGLWSGSQAATTQRDTEIATLKEENGRLKSANYDLLMSVGANETDIKHTDSEDKEPTLDDIFIKKNRNR